MINGWIVLTGREGVRLKAYGPFSSRDVAQAWLDKNPLTWRVAHVCRVIELRNDI
jgi:hypothetical protein